MFARQAHDVDLADPFVAMRTGQRASQDVACRVFVNVAGFDAGGRPRLRWCGWSRRRGWSESRHRLRRVGVAPLLRT